MQWKQFGEGKEDKMKQIIRVEPTLTGQYLLELEDGTNIIVEESQIDMEQYNKIIRGRKDGDVTKLLKEIS
jgi:hypothetical protein